MTPARQAWLASICIVLFALVMGGLHYLMTGFDEQFGSGIAIGLMLGGGLVFLASRQARNAP